MALQWQWLCVGYRRVPGTDWNNLLRDFLLTTSLSTDFRSETIGTRNFRVEREGAVRTIIQLIAQVQMDQVEVIDLTCKLIE